MGVLVMSRLAILLIGLLLCSLSYACPTIVTGPKSEDGWIECSDYVFGYFLKYQDDSRSLSDEELKRYWTKEQIKVSEEYDEEWVKRRIRRQREIVSDLLMRAYYGRCHYNSGRCELFLKIEVIQGRFPYAHGLFEVNGGKLIAADLTLETDGVAGMFNKFGPYKTNNQVRSLMDTPE